MKRLFIVKVIQYIYFPENLLIVLLFCETQRDSLSLPILQ